MKHFYQKVDDPMVTAYGKYISLGFLFCYRPRAYRHSVLRQKTSVSKTDFPSPGRKYILPNKHSCE